VDSVDEGVAGHRFERGARGIGGEFVITRDDPDFATGFDADLGGTENMTRRVQRDADSADMARLTIPDGFDRSGVAKTRAEHMRADRGGQVDIASKSCVIGVRVGNNCAIHGVPGIDVEVASRAVESIGRSLEQ
jgi:hypothetical protein